MKKTDISPEALAQIDALCEAMDREAIWAGTAAGLGRTMLDDARDHWMKCARDGRPLPPCWGSDAEMAQVETRVVEYGTREWRKAHPRWVEWLRRNGFNA